MLTAEDAVELIAVEEGARQASLDYANDEALPRIDQSGCGPPSLLTRSAAPKRSNAIGKKLEIFYNK